MDVWAAPRLAGIRHLKLPVIDLSRSREWYQAWLEPRPRNEVT
jgi:hypothetical protein